MYTFVTRRKAYYVGSTYRGLGERLGHYEKASTHYPTATRVRGEIVKILKKGGRVTVYALNPHEYEWNGLLVDPIAAIERMLIKSLDPEWNLQHTKTGQPKRGTHWSN